MKKTALLAVVMLILAVVGWLAAGPHPQPSTHAVPTAAPTAVSSGSSSSPSHAPTPGALAGADREGAAPPGVLPVTDESDVYAAAVATVVFGMDTRDHDPQAYRDLLLGQADPHMSSTGYADFERLLAERVPTRDQWARMRGNAQWSTFEPTDVWEPGSWTQVVIAGQAEPGWVVRNVTGVQSTHYSEHGVAKSAGRERSVTIAMRCPAPGAGVQACRLVLIGGSVLP